MKYLILIVILASCASNKGGVLIGSHVTESFTEKTYLLDGVYWEVTQYTNGQVNIARRN